MTHTQGTRPAAAETTADGPAMEGHLGEQRLTSIHAIGQSLAIGPMFSAGLLRWKGSTGCDRTRARAGDTTPTSGWSFLRLFRGLSTTPADRRPRPVRSCTHVPSDRVLLRPTPRNHV